MYYQSVIRHSVFAFATLLFSLSAYATWNGEVVVSNASLQDLQSANLSFVADDGTASAVTVKGEDKDGNVILGIAFSGNAASEGTLDINRPGRSQSIDMPAAAPGQNIYVDASGPGRASLLRPANLSAAPASIYFPANQIGVGYGTIGLEGDSIATGGTVLPAGPGTERPAIPMNYDLDATGGSFTYAHNLGRGLPGWADRGGISSNLTLGFTYGSYSDDKDFRFVEPAAGSDVGYLLTALNPAPNDQTGANFANFGMQSTGSIDVDYDRFEGFLDWLCGRETRGDSFYKSRFSVSFTEWDIDVTSQDIFEPTFPAAQYFNNRRQSLDQNIFEIGLGTTLINPLGNSGRFDAFAGATARIYWSDAKLKSFERFNIGNPSEDTRTVNQSDDEVDLGLDLNAGFGWNITSNVRAVAEAIVRLNVPSASIDNPVLGNGSNPGSNVLSLTHINYDNETQVSALIGVNYVF